MKASRIERVRFDTRSATIRECREAVARVATHTASRLANEEVQRNPSHVKYDALAAIDALEAK
jgi:hypothetical protein